MRSIRKKVLVLLRKINRILCTLGFHPLQTINLIRHYPLYHLQLTKLKKQKGDNTDFSFGMPSLRFGTHNEAGVMSGHYFHQDLLVAKRIYNEKPVRHVDIGSRIDGFVAHVAVFREIEIFDILPQKNKVPNISFTQADLTSLPPGMENYCDSVSSLHAIEHFGLGRYGDPIDYYGHLKAIDTIHKILKEDGTFYFSVPIGKQRIEFNAQRVFAIQYLLDVFKGKFAVQNFSYVDDLGDVFENVELTDKQIKNNFSCTYGCGIFELKKVQQKLPS